MLEGLNPGASEVTATFGGYTARLMVTVTDELKVVLEPASVVLTLKPASVTPTPKPAPSEDTTPDGTTPAPEGSKPDGAGDPAGEDPSTEGSTETIPPTEPTTPPTGGDGGETPPEPTPPTYEPSDPVTVKLELVDKNGKVLTVTSWEAECADADKDVAEVTVDDKKNTITVKGLKQGETQISITATYTLNSKEYTATTLLPVTVKEPEPSDTATTARNGRR